MQNKLFLKAADICELLVVKQTSAYEIIGNLNKELEEQESSGAVPEEVITEYCNAIFSSGADIEEFFYRLGLKDGLNMKSTVKSVIDTLS